MDYTLNDATYSAAAGLVPAAVDNFAHKWVGNHYLIAFAVIVVLLIVVIWLIFWKGKEHMNPTQTLLMQSQDQNNVGRHKESLDSTAPGTDRSTSVFAQTTQSSGGGQFTIDPNAAANQPGSLGYQVLHSADFACDTRTPVGSDAWSWMNTQLSTGESMGNPKTDNSFSKVLAGLSP